MRTTRAFNVVFGVLALSLVVATAASAQDTPTTNGPLTVETIQSGWVFTPEVRAADLGAKTGALAGGYLGHMWDRQWVVGFGGYYLTNGDRNFAMQYVGPVFEWQVRADRKIGFGLRTLVGGGSATMPMDVTFLVNPRATQGTARNTPEATAAGTRITRSISVHDDFLIAEPQAQMSLNLSKGQRIVFGVGYRATAYANSLQDSLNGLSGTVAFQIGGK